jgi:hypothetical protein
MTDTSKTVPLAEVAEYSDRDLIDLIDQVVVLHFTENGEAATVAGTLEVVLRTDEGFALKFVGYPDAVPVALASDATLSTVDWSF